MTKPGGAAFFQDMTVHSPLVRKALWSGLYAGLGAIATMAARRVASRIWRLATGEAPPAKK